MMNAAALPPIEIPAGHNYIAAFLTIACNLRCSFCINTFAGGRRALRTIPGEDWVRGLNRIVSRPDLPVTLQGGEPTLHADVVDIILGLREDLAVDILTNLQFKIDDFMRRVPPERVRREAPYASIRVSYHPEQMDLETLVTRVSRMLERGYSIGIWAVEHPEAGEDIARAREACDAAGIDFRTKAFLGRHDGRLYGEYRYPDAVAGERGEPVACRTTELLIGPTGEIFRCHYDLYQCRPPIGHLLDPAFAIEEIFRPCNCYGLCNPCDIKVKTNRLQEFGHTSVEIRPLG